MPRVLQPASSVRAWNHNQICGGPTLTHQTASGCKRGAMGCGIAYLLQDGQRTTPLFEAIFDGLRTEPAIPLYEDEITKWKKTDPQIRAGGKAEGRIILDHQQTMNPNSMGPLKKMQRVEVKCKTDYVNEIDENSTAAERCTALRFVVDVVRASLTFGTSREMEAALRWIVNEGPKFYFPSQNPDVAPCNAIYHVVRVKQTFNAGNPLSRSAAPGMLVYGDIKVLMLVRSYHPSRQFPVGGHICELQLHHIGFVQAKNKSGHHAYTKMRKLQEMVRARSNNTAELPEEFSEMNKWQRARMMGIIHDSHHAYRMARIQFENDSGSAHLIKTAAALAQQVEQRVPLDCRSPHYQQELARKRQQTAHATPMAGTRRWTI